MLHLEVPGEGLPGPLPRLVALGIPWLVIEDRQSLPRSSHGHFLPSCLHVLFPLCVLALCPNFPFLERHRDG